MKSLFFPPPILPNRLLVTFLACRGCMNILFLHTYYRIASSSHYGTIWVYSRLWIYVLPAMLMIVLNYYIAHRQRWAVYGSTFLSILSLADYFLPSVGAPFHYLLLVANLLSATALLLLVRPLWHDLH